MKETKQLEEKILYHKALYYQGRPEISDLEYDALEEKLKKIDPKNKVLTLVGTITDTNGKVPHKSRMLSLNKAYELSELVQWSNGDEVVSTYKVDGVSGSLIYKDGQLNLAKTRGDGSFGEDITSKVQWIADVAGTISDKEEVEVRGEIFCTEENFFLLSEEMIKLGLDRPTSQRNIVAGLIGRKDHVELCRYLSFQAFELIYPDQRLKNEMEKFKRLDQLGFTTPDYQLHKSEKSIKERIESARLFMSEGDYQIDGLVFTLNSIAKHEELGETSHHPRYKMAFKYRGESKTTTIEKIEWGVSRNGILTPVANVAPVELSGAEIRRVTLHNYGMVVQYGLKTGDEIEVIRSGEVIPKFVSVIKAANGRVDFPKVCPECKTQTRIETIRLYCDNEECPAKVKETILNFITKIGIEDLSTKRLEEMMRKEVVQTIPDLYKLTRNELLTLDKTKDKMADKILSEIEKSKDVDIITFLSALGISGGAYNRCEKVVQAGFDTIDKILALKHDDLTAIEGFAEKSATEFLTSLQTKHKLIKQLEKHGFSFEAIEISDNPIKGKKICITGALSEKRSTIEAKIREYGGVVTGSVSKATDYLLTNETDSASSKFKKAKELSVAIISEAQFFQMVK